MIIEGLLTTTTPTGEPHVAPMGPLVDAELTNWTLRPFSSSNTFRNLQANPHCVFHVVDDVVPVVEAALGLPTSLSFERLLPEVSQEPLQSVSGAPTKSSTKSRGSPQDACEQKLTSSLKPVWTLPSACHWYHLLVDDWDTSAPRTSAKALLLERQIQRPFWGWNRAKHAVMEATILATRLHMVSHAEIAGDLQRLEQVVHKTAGERELQAWHLLHDFFRANS